MDYFSRNHSKYLLKYGDKIAIIAFIKSIIGGKHFD